MKPLLFFLLSSLSGALGEAITDEDLCGKWKQSIESTNGKLCVQTPRCSRPSPPRVTETFDFLSVNNTYVYTNIQYSAGSCNLNTLEFHITTGGTYLLRGETVTGWTGIEFTPIWFYVRVLTAGRYSYPLNSTDTINCMDFLAELNVGCACNGTWEYNANRTVAPADCPNATCDDPNMLLDIRTRYGNIQIRQNNTNNTKYLVLSETDVDEDVGFNITTVDFSQTPACGRGCKSCTVGINQGVNCTDCCDRNALPINSTSASDCQCKAKYHNRAPDNFTLVCHSGASSISSGFLVVFGLLSLLLGSAL